MCGHIAVYFKNNKNKEYKEQLIKKMTDTIYHRGPDDVGFFHNEKVTFGFRRLSIIDVEHGHQPMEKDNMAMIFNGEVYNHNELRENLISKGYEFKTNSDTEVLITSYIDQRENCVDSLRGMFAFLIWDEEKQKVFGARDMFGIKPLYYIEDDDMIAFASEYKALTEIAEFKEVNQKNLQLYLSYQYTPTNETMIKNINKIPPGHSFSIENDKLLINKYFDVNFTPNKNISKEDIHKVLYDSVEHHMLSDVEVGTFLSGGIDSTIIATLASQINPKIKSFSVGFDVDGYNEIDVASKTAKMLNIENIQVKVNQQQYIKELPNAIYSLDDPLADPSALGIYFLSKEARKYVTVVLSGEGADELFGGYNIYKEYFSIKPFLNMPSIMKKMINSMARRMANIRGKNYLIRATTPIDERYIGNAKIFENEEVKKIIKNYNEHNNYQSVTKDLYQICRENKYDYVTTMQYIDMHTWLPGDILLKGDKMSMNASIELRVPFLDKDVFELSKQLNLKQKVSKSQTKILLREAFKDIIPQHVVQKRKLGFPTPIRVWLKEDLGHVVKQTIMEANVDEQINKKYAMNLLDEHILGKKDNSRKIWTIFVYCLWHQMYIEKKKIIF